MIGLGDVLIPGMFASLALRYDLIANKEKGGSTPYFVASFIGFFIGLGFALFMNGYT